MKTGGKSFDEESDSGTILTLTDLAAIGPDAGEVYPLFDDFPVFRTF